MFSTTFLLTALLVTFGATVATMAGFGFAISTMPFILLLYQPKAAVPLLLVISAVGNIVQWIRVRNDADYPLVFWMALGGVFGAPVGGQVLKLVDPAIMKAVIGFAVLAAVILNLVNQRKSKRPARRPKAWLAVITGLAGGVLSTGAGQSGLAVSLLMAWTGWDKSAIRATLFTFFAVMNVESTATLTVQHILTWPMALVSFSLLPCYFLGIWIGEKGFRRFSQRSYRYVMLTVLSASAVMGVVNGLKGLLVK